MVDRLLHGPSPFPAGGVDGSLDGERGPSHRTNRFGRPRGTRRDGGGVGSLRGNDPLPGDGRREDRQDEVPHAGGPYGSGDQTHRRLGAGRPRACARRRRPRGLAHRGEGTPKRRTGPGEAGLRLRPDARKDPGGGHEDSRPPRSVPNALSPLPPSPEVSIPLRRGAGLRRGARRRDRSRVPSPPIGSASFARAAPPICRGVRPAHGRRPTPPGSSGSRLGILGYREPRVEIAGGACPYGL